METFNVHKFHQVARMDRETFVKLRLLLIEIGGLKNSLYICADQKIMILLHVIRGYTIRETMERWQHSGSTISNVVHEASELLNCRALIFQPALLGAPVPIQIANFSKFSPFFACIPSAEQQPLIDSKKNISQNVLGVANFDLTFAYGLFGWEGSAHDSRVFQDSKLKELPMLPGKFYLGDGGYGLS
jgi:hypothetical protein